VEFVTTEDARVREANPTTNYGTSSTLQADFGASANVESYLKFTVADVEGVTSAKVRLFVHTGTASHSNDGPAIYTAPLTWQENTLTWSTRPARGTTALDDLGSVSIGTWVEYDVTSVVTGNGNYGFALATISTDATDFQSGETANPPRLVITGISGGPTPTTAAPTQTPTPTTVVPTPTATTAGPTATTAAPTPTATPSSILTVSAVADARVEEGSPGTNFGTVSRLVVDGGADPDKEAYVRFTVNGVTSTVQNARLRLFVPAGTSTGTANGPDLYSVINTWTETGVTWSNRPDRTSGIIGGDTAAIPADSWVEYDVTGFVTANGTYGFGLVPESSDAVEFNSREATSNRPELLLTLASSGTPIPSPTPLPLPTPTPSNPTPTPTPGPSTGVIVAAGDIAVCGTNNNDEETAKLLDVTPGEVLILGDNAYNSGTLTEFNNCYHPTWGRHKARTHPIPGNHDYSGSSNARGYYDYFNGVGVFSGPAGDRDKGYYSFNVGSWHVVAINSCATKPGGVCNPGTAQVSWLQADLAANSTACTLAYWHHPHFSSGHDSNNGGMMTAVFQALYDAGADVVLVGHSHDYERFAPQRPNGTLDNSFGIREFVIGTGGAPFTGGSQDEPNSQVFNKTTYGVVKLTLQSNGYNWQFIPIAGQSFSDTGSASCHGVPSASVNGPDTAQRSQTIELGAISLPIQPVLAGAIAAEGGILAYTLWSRTGRSRRSLIDHLVLRRWLPMSKPTSSVADRSPPRKP
jgi:acid phosphatase type 7